MSKNKVLNFKIIKLLSFRPSIFLLLLFFFAVSRAQMIGSGSCPKVDVVDEFSLENFLGTWYRVQAYPDFSNIVGSCISWDFNQAENEKITLQINENRFGLEEFETAHGEIVRPGVILISHEDSILARPNSNYYIINTDYENYAVVYTCSRGFFYRTQNVWILSRKSVLEDVYLEEAKSSLKAEGISTTFLTATSQRCASETS